MKKRFWLWVLLKVYTYTVGPEGQKPVGIPGNRDPECPCDGYSPRPRYFVEETQRKMQTMRSERRVSVVLALITGNFVYQGWLQDAPDWETAIERSYFQVLAVGIVYLSDWWGS